MSTPFRILCGVMALLYASWAYFQLNDPDFEPWVALYATVAVFSGLATFGVSARGGALGVAVVTLAWALLVVPQALSSDLLAFFKEIEGEPWRELFGLVITMAWTGVLWTKTRVPHVRPEPA